jgi:hypothetical protein
MRSRRTAIIIVGVILVACGTWVLLSGPMLINLRTGPFSGHQEVIVLNPIRNRTPERYAASLLAEIQSPACQQAVTGLGILDQQKTEACYKQERDPIRAPCKLIERSDKGTSSWLLFHCPYERATEARAEIGLTVEQVGRNQYLLRSYERIY